MGRREDRMMGKGTDKVTVVCYGKAQEWDRWEAIDFFMQGAAACDGSEKERYTTILLKLMAGEEVCSDDVL